MSWCSTAGCRGCTSTANRQTEEQENKDHEDENAATSRDVGPPRLDGTIEFGSVVRLGRGGDSRAGRAADLLGLGSGAPNETVLVVGCDFGQAPVVEAARLGDGGAAPSAATAAWVRPAVLQGGDSSLKFVVPADWKPGLFAFRVLGPGGASARQVLNPPDPWWWQGDGGAAASPGGWLRVFGKSLQLGQTAGPSCARRRSGRSR